MERASNQMDGNKGTISEMFDAVNSITQSPTSHDSLKALGNAVALMMASPRHKYLFLADIESMILPPILLGQAKLYSTDKGPVAFAIWANLSADVEQRWLYEGARLSPADWNSGDRLWLVEIISPMGHGEVAMEDLRQTVFAGLTFQVGPGVIR